MATTRRQFLRCTGLTAVAGGLAANPLAGLAQQAVRAAARPLRILILGGTGFIGPHQVTYALARGHHLTLHNRGRRAPDLFPEVETILGDRNGDLAELRGRSWDVVIDNPATDPGWVTRSASLLAPHCRHYIYVSSISAYFDNSREWQDESARLCTPENTRRGADGSLPFGLAKALCEAEAEKHFPGRCTIIRPGLIVGPGDESDRFTYWVDRIDRGGEVLAPGPGSDPVQIIDARDLSEWMIRVAEEGAMGPFNAAGPAREMRMDEMLYGIRAVVATPVWFTWADAAFLAEHRVRPWQDMPCWVPPEGAMLGFSRWSVQRALDHGLTYRPLAVTARETLHWHNARDEDRRRNLRFGLPAEREAAVLADWHARSRRP